MSDMSYQKDRYWEKYQPFFPPHLRTTDTCQPEEGWWQWNGINVHLDRQTADNAKPIKIILLHGGGGHGRLLAPLGKMLKREGYSSVAPDLPGYGMTKSPARYVDYREWINLCVDLVKAEVARDGHPVVLFGLSLGGMLSYYVAAKIQQEAQSQSAPNNSPVCGLIVTTLCDPRYQEVRDGFVKNRFLSRWLLPVTNLLKPLIGSLRLPIRWFSKMDSIANTDNLSRVVLQDRRGGGSLTPISFMLSIMNTTPAVEPEHFHGCPLLLAHPARDLWTPYALSEPFFERLNTPKELVLLAQAGHIPVEEPGLSQLHKAVTGFLAELAPEYKETTS